MNIEYTKNLSNITEDMLTGFFVGWLNPPSSETHLKILKDSYCSYIATDRNSRKVVGFVNSISDGVLTAYIPLLEVLPEYQGQGIGSELTKLILTELKGLYMIDICHDEGLTRYYSRFGAHTSCSSIFRNYAAQSGRVEMNAGRRP
jgi:ribosomal protein S18 acetylase RimI-like enzyme